MTIASILLDLWREEGGAFEALPPGPGTPKKPRRNRVNSFFVICCCSLFLLFVGLEPVQNTKGIENYAFIY